MKAYKTAVFKLHNPSQRKRAMLRDALTRNHRAYSKLLDALLPEIETFAAVKRGKWRENAIAKRASLKAKALPLAIGAKAGVVSDIAGQLSSHIELRAEQENTSTPTAARLNGTQGDYLARLDALATSTTLEAETAARDAFLAEVRGGKRRPVLYLKNRKTDGFLLLYSEEKQNYYLWLNLHPKDSRFARRVAVDGLVDVRTGEVMSFSSATGALFPVAFGRDFQLERFIREARPQSAKLLETNGRFEVHITFEYEAPAVTADTRLGVDRGIYNLASMSVIDETGTVMDSENLDGRALRHVQRIHERRQRDTQRRGRRYSGRSRRAMADEAVHVTANRIVEVARHNRSQVVLENLRQLTSTGRKRARSNFNRLLTRSQYQKLQRVLEYKLAVVGLPSPKTVSAAYTSQTCPHCGFQARENRLKVPDGDGFKMDRFECLRCGHQADADINAARVIALKRAWRESLPASQRPKTMAEMPPKHAFESFLRIRAEMRDDGPCDLRVGTSGGHELREAGPNPPEQSGGNLTPARTPRRTEKSAAKPPRLSSSSGNPPPLRGDRHGKSDA